MIIFLYGDDTYRIQKRLKELKDGFMEKFDKDGNDLVQLDGSKVNSSDVFAAVGSMSLFSERRMVIIDSIFTNKNKEILKQLLEYFESNDNENIVVFTENTGGFKSARSKFFLFLKKQPSSVEYLRLTNMDLNNWVKKEFADMDVDIDSQAINTIAGNCGGDLWQANNDIQKIINYKKGLSSEGQRVVVCLEDVEKMSRGTINENIFAFTDAISNKNKKLAAKLLEDELEAGTAEMYLMTMIVRHFRILLMVKAAMERGEIKNVIASQLKLHPFVVQKGMTQARGFKLDELRDIYSGLLKSDAEVKTGQNNFKTIMSLLIANL